MFVVFLKFSANRSRAREWMAAHNAWLQRGFEEGVFAASGSLQEQQGGCVLAHGLDRARLEQRLGEDPFIVHDVVSAEIVEVAISRVEPRLAFLMETAA